MKCKTRRMSDIGGTRPKIAPTRSSTYGEGDRGHPDARAVELRHTSPHIRAESSGTLEAIDLARRPRQRCAVQHRRLTRLHAREAGVRRRQSSAVPAFDRVCHELSKIPGRRPWRARSGPRGKAKAVDRARSPGHAVDVRGAATCGPGVSLRSNFDHRACRARSENCRGPTSTSPPLRDRTPSHSVWIPSGAARARLECRTTDAMAHFRRHRAGLGDESLSIPPCDPRRARAASSACSST